MIDRRQFLAVAGGAAVVAAAGPATALIPETAAVSPAVSPVVEAATASLSISQPSENFRHNGALYIRTLGGINFSVRGADGRFFHLEWKSGDPATLNDFIRGIESSYPRSCVDIVQVLDWLRLYRDGIEYRQLDPAPLRVAYPYVDGWDKPAAS